MNSSISALLIFLLLIPSCSTTGILWIRMSSSVNVVARVEFIDRENSSRYGISFDTQLHSHHKEFVIPMPSPSSNSSIPILNYGIRTKKSITGNNFGKKYENILPLLVNETWIHKTLKDENNIFIHVSIRSECLPNYYGSICQYYCSPGEKCPIMDCREKKCQNYSKCHFDGTTSECKCQQGYFGELCEKKTIAVAARNPVESLILLATFIIFLTLCVVFIFASYVLKAATSIRNGAEPMKFSVVPELNLSEK
ncbi:CRE-SDZ-23 protein [Caenorhabditis remanei]|uniref:CRE-SDZ-23 protein n=1 Tax=Caenorhabditis remanei TaxID=31234 RepID=E3M0Q3_CAERE|nr:CRE-SDZ-23 protein [Caenorhabditis remanei]